MARGIRMSTVRQGEARQPQVQVGSANGAITIIDGYVYLTKAGVAAMTLADPPLDANGVTLTILALTANAHTVSNAAGSGFNGGGAGADVGTFGGAVGDKLVVTAYGGKWYVVHNTNVTLA